MAGLPEEQADLLRQVQGMTPEEIDALPEVQRSQIQGLRTGLAANPVPQAAALRHQAAMEAAVHVRQYVSHKSKHGDYALLISQHMVRRTMGKSDWGPYWDEDTYNDFGRPIATLSTIDDHAFARVLSEFKAAAAQFEGVEVRVVVETMERIESGGCAYGTSLLRPGENLSDVVESPGENIEAVRFCVFYQPNLE